MTTKQAQLLIMAALATLFLLFLLYSISEMSSQTWASARASIFDITNSSLSSQSKDCIVATPSLATPSTVASNASVVSTPAAAPPAEVVYKDVAPSHHITYPASYWQIRPSTHSWLDDPDRDYPYISFSNRTDQFYCDFVLNTTESVKSDKQSLRECINQKRASYWVDKNQHRQLPCHKQRKVYDIFGFNDEMDMLEIHVAEMYDVVDYFVIVESKLSFSGLSKELHYQKHQQRFQQWADKIIHVVCDLSQVGKHVQSDMDDDRRAFLHESASRNCGHLALSHATKHDLIIVSDVDEIVRPEVLSAVKTCHQHLYPYMYQTNSWIGVFGVRFISSFRFRDRKFVRWGKLKIGLLGAIRSANRGVDILRHVGDHDKNQISLEFGGWHCSWCFFGHGENVESKYKSWSEQAMSKRVRKNLTDYQEFATRCVTSVNEGFRCDLFPYYYAVPQYVQDNAHRFQQHIPATNETILYLPDRPEPGSKFENERLIGIVPPYQLTQEQWDAIHPGRTQQGS